MSRARLIPVALALPAVLLLPACGSGDAGATNAAPTSAAAEGGPGGRFRNGDQFQEIQECLTAAGIAVPTPSGTFRRPTGTPGEGFTPPSGAPDGTPPSGGPGGGRGGGGFGQMFQDPQAKAALAACGITVPTGRPSGGPRPSSTPSSSPSASPSA